MDPITAGIQAFAAWIALQQTIVEGMDPATKAEYGKLVLSDAQRWHDFFGRFQIKVP